MSRDWHEQFKRWAKPPSDTEEQKGSAAAEMIRGAIRASEALKDKNVEVYATGSYRNNTNIRLSSDIDIAVVLHNSVYSEKPPGLTDAILGFSPATYLLDHLRADVGAALVARFGSTGVTAGYKAFDVHETSSRLDADVAVFLEHRRYTGKQLPNGSWEYLQGVEMRPRNAPDRRVINWHQHHYDAGVAKNDRTGRRFKRVVRILKCLSLDMQETGSPEACLKAKAAPSFQIECLVFNAPDERFNRVEGSYHDDVRDVIAWLWNQTKAGAAGENFKEINGLKPLFDQSQGWTMPAAHDFLLAAWHHVGFKNP